MTKDLSPSLCMIQKGKKFDARFILCTLDKLRGSMNNIIRLKTYSEIEYNCCGTSFESFNVIIYPQLQVKKVKRKILRYSTQMRREIPEGKKSEKIIIK